MKIKIYYAKDIGTTPARINRYTGELYINLKLWEKMPFEHRFFILLHEFGHLFLNTSDEDLVDEFAFYIYSQKGFSLTQSIYALSKVLSFNNPEHWWRVYRQFERAKEYDYFINNNKNAYNN